MYVVQSFTHARKSPEVVFLFWMHVMWVLRHRDGTPEKPQGAKRPHRGLHSRTLTPRPHLEQSRMLVCFKADLCAAVWPHTVFGVTSPSTLKFKGLAHRLLGFHSLVQTAGDEHSLKHDPL